MAVDPKRAAFTRLAERRTNKLLDNMRLLGNLSNPHTYSYTDDDVRLMFSAIERELKATRSRFRNPGKKKFLLPHSQDEQ